MAEHDLPVKISREQSVFTIYGAVLMSRIFLKTVCLSGASW